MMEDVVEPEIYDALVDLKQSIDKQNELQATAIANMQELTRMLAFTIDAIKELTEEINEGDDA